MGHYKNQHRNLWSSVHIVIKDIGMGISEEVVSEIFKPFFSTKTLGSGLGLRE